MMSRFTVFIIVLCTIYTATCKPHPNPHEREEISSESHGAHGASYPGSLAATSAVESKRRFGLHLDIDRDAHMAGATGILAGIKAAERAASMSSPGFEKGLISFRRAGNLAAGGLASVMGAMQTFGDRGAEEFSKSVQDTQRAGQLGNAAYVRGVESIETAGQIGLSGLDGGISLLEKTGQMMAPEEKSAEREGPIAATGLAGFSKSIGIHGSLDSSISSGAAGALVAHMPHQSRDEQRGGVRTGSADSTPESKSRDQTPKYEKYSISHSSDSQSQSPQDTESFGVSSEPTSKNLKTTDKTHKSKSAKYAVPQKSASHSPVLKSSSDSASVKQSGPTHILISFANLGPLTNIGKPSAESPEFGDKYSHSIVSSSPQDSSSSHPHKNDRTSSVVVNPAGKTSNKPTELEMTTEYAQTTMSHISSSHPTNDYISSVVVTPAGKIGYEPEELEINTELDQTTKPYMNSHHHTKDHTASIAVTPAGKISNDSIELEFNTVYTEITTEYTSPMPSNPITTPISSTESPPSQSREIIESLELSMQQVTEDPYKSMQSNSILYRKAPIQDTASPNNQTVAHTEQNTKMETDSVSTSSVTSRNPSMKYVLVKETSPQDSTTAKDSDPISRKSDTVIYTHLKPSEHFNKVHEHKPGNTGAHVVSYSKSNPQQDVQTGKGNSENTGSASGLSGLLDSIGRGIKISGGLTELFSGTGHSGDPSGNSAHDLSSSVGSMGFRSHSASSPGSSSSSSISNNPDSTGDISADSKTDSSFGSSGSVGSMVSSTDSKSDSSSGSMKDSSVGLSGSVGSMVSTSDSKSDSSSGSKHDSSIGSSGSVGSMGSTTDSQSNTSPASKQASSLGTGSSISLTNPAGSTGWPGATWRHGGGLFSRAQQALHRALG